MSTEFLAQQWLGAMWDALWQGSVAFALVWAICKVFPRLPARIRCWLWRLVLVKPLVMLLAIPQISLAVLPRARTMVALMVSEELAAAIPDRYTFRSTLSKPLGCAWLLGVAVGVVYTTMALRKVRSFSRRCVPVHDQEIQADLARLCRVMRIGGTPQLVTADCATVPLLIRLGREYAVVLPATMLDPTRCDNLSLSLAHELAHIKRKDLTWNWLPTICRVLFFPNPLVWIAGREMGIAQEMACDALAIGATGADVRQYGKLLLSMVTSCPTNELGWATGVSVSAGAPARQMRQRLLGLKFVGDTPGWRVSLGTLVLVLACLLTLPFQLAEAPRMRAGDSQLVVDRELIDDMRYDDVRYDDVRYVVRADLPEEWDRSVDYTILRRGPALEG